MIKHGVHPNTNIPQGNVRSIKSGSRFHTGAISSRKTTGIYQAINGTEQLAARVIVHRSTAQFKFLQTVHLSAQVSNRIIYLCIAQTGSKTHGIQRHLQINGNVFQCQLVQGYFPIKGGSRSVRFGSGSIIHHNEHMSITQFHTIDDGILFLQVYAMAFKEETSQYATYADPLYQIGRVQENSVHGYLIHFYLSTYQRPCLHAHVQAFQG